MEKWKQNIHIYKDKLNYSMVLSHKKSFPHCQMLACHDDFCKSYGSFDRVEITKKRKVLWREQQLIMNILSERHV